MYPRVFPKPRKYLEMWGETLLVIKYKTRVYHTATLQCNSFQTHIFVMGNPNEKIIKGLFECKQLEWFRIKSARIKGDRVALPRWHNKNGGNDQMRPSPGREYLNSPKMQPLLFPLQPHHSRTISRGVIASIKVTDSRGQSSGFTESSRGSGGNGYKNMGIWWSRKPRDEVLMESFQMSMETWKSHGKFKFELSVKYILGRIGCWYSCGHFNEKFTYKR